MKKLAFVGIFLFGISFCVSDLWGKSARSSKRYTNKSSDVQKNKKSNKVNAFSRERRSRDVPDDEDDDRSSNRSKTTSKRRRNKNVSDKKRTSRSSRNISSITLEESVSSVLKNIITSVPSTDIRSLTSNMSVLSRSLSRKSKEKDIKTVIKKMDDASVRLDELLRVKSNLYQELFNKTEKREELSDSVALDGIINALNSIDMKKFKKIISICDQEGLSSRIIRSLEDFADEIKKSRNILTEIQKKFSPVMLSRIEGIPELKHLESTNTSANRELEKRRKDMDVDETSEDESEEKSNTKVFEEEDPEETLQDDLEDEKKTKSAKKIKHQSSKSSQKHFEKQEKDEEDAEKQFEKQENDEEDAKRLDQEKKQAVVALWRSKISAKKATEEKDKLKNDAKTDEDAAENEDSNTKSSEKKSPVKSDQSESESTSQKPDKKAKSSWNPFKWLTNKNDEDRISEKNEKKSEEISEKDNLAKKNSDETKDSSEVVEYKNKPVQKRKNSHKTVNSEEESEPDKNEKSSSSYDKKIIDEESISQDSQEMSEGSDSSAVDSDNTESLKQFYAFLETNIKSLDDDALTNKQKTMISKIQGYLKETKTNRNFEQKITDVRRIIRAYNSLVALNPKTKKGKKLLSVKRDKIKIFQEQIYVEIFDDLQARLKKLKLDEKLNGLDIQEDFDTVLSLNAENKKEFCKSRSGKDKRKIMTSSAEAYDKLMEKIWKYPKLVKTKKDREKFDRIGYTLDPVILSISVDEK